MGDGNISIPIDGWTSCTAAGECFRPVSRNRFPGFFGSWKLFWETWGWLRDEDGEVLMAEGDAFFCSTSLATIGTGMRVIVDYSVNNKKMNNRKNMSTIKLWRE